MKIPPKVNYNRIEHKRYIAALNLNDLDGSLTQACKRLQDLRRKYKKYKELFIQVHYYSYEGPDVSLYGTQTETDKEYKIRITLEEKQLANYIKIKEKKKNTQEEKEHATYERLKKKYEK